MRGSVSSSIVTMPRDDVFRCILSQLDVPVLHRHCECVVANELRRVRADLTELRTVYERLEEVRAAVALAEHSRADVGRTPSLMRTIDEASRVGGGLVDRVRLLGEAIGWPRVESRAGDEERVVPEPPPKRELIVKKRKRGRVESTSQNLASDTETENEEAPRRTKVPRADAVAVSNGETEAASSATPHTAEEPEATCSPRPAANAKSNKTVTPSSVMETSLEVSKALSIAQKLERAASESPPTKAQLADLLKLLVHILTTVRITPGARVRGVAGGRFATLLTETEGLLRGVKHRRLAKLLVRTIINAISKAIARDASLSGLSEYQKKFEALVQEMETGPEKEAQDRTPVVDGDRANPIELPDDAPSPTDKPDPLQRLAALVNLADDVRQTGDCKRPGALSLFVAKVEHALRAVFPKKLKQPDTRTVEVAARAITTTVELMTKQTVTKHSVFDFQAFANYLNSLNSKSKSMRARLQKPYASLLAHIRASHIPPPSKKQLQKFHRAKRLPTGPVTW